MKTLIHSLLIALVISIPSAGWCGDGGGSGVGNGGDTYTEQDFATSLQLVHEFLMGEASRGYYDYVSKEDLQEVNSRLFPRGKESPLRYSSASRLFLKRDSSGWHTPITQKAYEQLSQNPKTVDSVKEVDAINFPSQLEIRISVSRWKEKDSAAKSALALHEMLGLLEKDLDYSISSRLESAIRGQGLMNGLGALAPARPGEPIPGVNGQISKLMLELRTSSGSSDPHRTYTWVSWKEYSAMEKTSGANAFFAMRSKEFVRFSFTDLGQNKALASITLRPIDPDYAISKGLAGSWKYAIMGELTRLPAETGKPVYYFRGPVEPISFLLGISPSQSRANRLPRLQRTDFYYDPNQQTLWMIWFACTSPVPKDCAPFVLEHSDSRPSDTSIGTAAAMYSLGGTPPTAEK